MKIQTLTENIDSLNISSFKKSLTNIVTVMTLATCAFSGAAFAGGKDSGGQMGGRMANGHVVPIDVLMAVSNSPMNVKSDPKYKRAYAYFEQKIADIRKVIPSFADDLVKNFNELSWTRTRLDLNNTTCLNQMGVLKLKKGQQEIGIACQDHRGRVLVSGSSLNAFSTMQLLGTTFLHEAMVRTMLKIFGDNLEKYNRAEIELTQYVMPYILLNSDYDAKKLYDHTVDIGFAGANLAENSVSKYLIETDRQAQEQYAEYLRWMAEREAEIKAVTDSIANLKLQMEATSKVFWPMHEIIKACDLRLEQFTSADVFMKYFESYLKTKYKATDAVINYSVAVESAAQDYRLTSSLRSGFIAEHLGNQSPYGPSYNRHLDSYYSAMNEMLNAPGKGYGAGGGLADQCSEKIKSATRTTPEIK